MTASVDAEDVVRGQNITFNFAHKMSMIEIKVPIRAYKTRDENPYEYSAPLGLKVTIGNTENYSLCTFGKEQTDDTGNEVTKGIYRCIVTPSDESLNVAGEFQDGSVPVYFPETNATLSVTPKAGECTTVDVGYIYDNYEATRDLQAGDYYYADGSICPGDMENIPSSNCVGVIFSTTTSETDQNNGWTHGYVIALNNTGTSAIRWKNAKTVDDNGTTFNIDVTDASTTTDSYQALIGHLDGYTASKKITDSSNEATHPAFFAAKNYAVSIPETTSGWYLPSMGQLTLVMNNLGGLEETNKLTASNCASFNSKPAVPNAVATLDGIFRKAGGGLFESEVGTETVSNRWWGCEQTTYNSTPSATADRAWCIDMNYGTDSNGNYAKYVFLARDKNDATNINHVRPVFAF